MLCSCVVRQGCWRVPRNSGQVEVNGLFIFFKLRLCVSHGGLGGDGGGGSTDTGSALMSFVYRRWFSW